MTEPQDKIWVWLNTHRCSQVQCVGLLSLVVKNFQDGQVDRVCTAANQELLRSVRQLGLSIVFHHHVEDKGGILDDVDTILGGQSRDDKVNALWLLYSVGRIDGVPQRGQDAGIGRQGDGDRHIPTPGRITLICCPGLQNDAGVLKCQSL